MSLYPLISPSGASPYTNNTNQYLVIVGWGWISASDVNIALTIKDKNGNITDQQVINQPSGFAGTPTPTQVAANWNASNVLSTVAGLSRKMIVFPQETITYNSGTNIKMIVCDTLAEAAAVSL